MGKRIPVNLLEEFSRFVESSMGLSFQKARRADLERGIGCAAHEFGFGDAESCIRWLLSSHLSKGQIETLASYLTVGETYFFRDGKSFDLLGEHIIPGLFRSRAGKERSIRIWSAGCATGEEPYSAAILLHRTIPDLIKWNITILATDINPRFLQKATEGVYSEWSFRETPGWVRENYFTKTKKGLEIREDIRNMVTFSYHNIIEDPFPSFLNSTNAMDIIFCRNVLIYFSQERARDAIRNFYRCLVNDGWLFVSAVEAPHTLFSGFRTMNFPGVILYRKTESYEKAPSIRISPEPLPVHPPPAPELRYKIPEIRPPVPPPISRPPAPKPPAADLYQEALRAYEQGRYAEAAEIINRSHPPLKPSGGEGGSDAKAMSLLARAYANQGRLSDALLWCGRAVASDKTNTEYHYLLATILQEAGRAEESIASLKRTLYLDQDYVPAHYLLANLYRRQGRKKESKKHFEISLSLLRSYPIEDVLPGSEGMIAGRMIEIINTMLEQGAVK
jgi:chemotaxis protein methyltransferase CheR